MKRLVPVLVLIVIAVMTWWWIQTNHRDSFKYSGTIEADDVALASKIGGRIVTVFVKEGERVQPGDMLVELDKEPISARLNEALALKQQSEARLAELENGPRPQEIDRARYRYEQAYHQWMLLKNGSRVEDIQAAKANVEALQAEVNLAELTVKRQRELFEHKNTSAENLDRAEKELVVSSNRLRAAEAEWKRLMAGFRDEEIAAAEAQVKAASAEWSLLLEGTRVEQIEQTKAELARIEAQIEQIKIDLNEKEIRAVTNAVVETCRIEPGDVLAPNQTALTCVLFEPLWMRIFVPESQLGRARIGAEIERVSVASFPNERFKGDHCANQPPGRIYAA